VCRNPKLWIVLGIATVAVVIAAPSLGAVLPLLLVAACPLAMLVMMGGMAGMARGKPGGTTSTPPADPEEMARLRAEVAELRERAAR